MLYVHLSFRNPSVKQTFPLQFVLVSSVAKSTLAILFFHLCFNPSANEPVFVCFRTMSFFHYFQDEESSPPLTADDK